MGPMTWTLFLRSRERGRDRKRARNPKVLRPATRRPRPRLRLRGRTRETVEPFRFTPDPHEGAEFARTPRWTVKSDLMKCNPVGSLAACLLSGVFFGSSLPP